MALLAVAFTEVMCRTLICLQSTAIWALHSTAQMTTDHSSSKIDDSVNLTEGFRLTNGQYIPSLLWSDYADPYPIGTSEWEER